MPDALCNGLVPCCEAASCCSLSTCVSANIGLQVIYYWTGTKLDALQVYTGITSLDMCQLMGAI